MQQIQHHRITTRLKAPNITIQESRKIIGDRMKEARLNSGMSQQDIAQILHCDQTTRWIWILLPYHKQSPKAKTIWHWNQFSDVYSTQSTKMLKKTPNFFLLGCLKTRVLGYYVQSDFSFSESPIFFFFSDFPSHEVHFMYMNMRLQFPLCSALHEVHCVRACSALHIRAFHAMWGFVRVCPFFC